MAPNPIMQFFTSAHLPDHLRPIAAQCEELAQVMHDGIPPCAELSAGLRKLLEAKDCFVRAEIQHHNLES